MGRKHGFSGTPVRPSPRPSSNAGVFEKRGDPLVSQKEGLTQYGRNIDSENPDYDRYFAGLARDLLKPAQTDTGNAFRKLTTRVKSPQDEANDVTNKMYKKIWNNKGKENKVIERTNADYSRIGCPYECGFSHTDSRVVSRHLRENCVKKHKM